MKVFHLHELRPTVVGSVGLEAGKPLRRKVKHFGIGDAKRTIWCLLIIPYASRSAMKEAKTITLHSNL
jgi:hypothetical protein